METVDPKDFIITRKRKKYKFALFANSPLCFELDEWDKQWQPDVLEIGAGTGQFMLELALLHPELNFVAVDVKGDRLQKGAGEAQKHNVTNIRFLRARADQLVEIFKPNKLQQIWLTFSDPFPRARSAGRRLTHSNFLGQYQTLLSDFGSLLIKHDNFDFFLWSLEQLVASGWTINQLSFDLHESELPEEYKILTTYEKRWLNEGRITKFVRALRHLS